MVGGQGGSVACRCGRFRLAQDGHPWCYGRDQRDNPKLPDERDDLAFENLIRYIQDMSRLSTFAATNAAACAGASRFAWSRSTPTDFTAYNAFLEADPHEFDGLLEHDPDQCHLVLPRCRCLGDAEAGVLPKLLASRAPDAIRDLEHRLRVRRGAVFAGHVVCRGMGPSDFSRRVKIYATDLDEAALTSHATPPIWRATSSMCRRTCWHKYFDHVDAPVVVSRELRKCVIFGRHNIVHDAPISRIDLLVCRNLLIYLETETQNARAAPAALCAGG